jgi:t-SNARE complex subunit (syntaxin)
MTIYQLYEALKQQYMQRHPDATNDEYEAAMAAICEVVGL